MKTQSWFLCSLALLGVLAACGHAPAPSATPKPAAAGAHVQPSQLVLGDAASDALARFDARMDRVLARPEVDRAFNVFVEKLIDDPRLGAQFERLVERLVADPKVAAELESITDDFANHPDVQGRVERLMKERPDLSPSQIGEVFGAQVEQAFEAIVGPAVEVATQRLVARLDVAAPLADLKRHLVLRFGRVLAAYFETPARLGAWNRRLIELNHGEMPDSALATSLIIDHAFSEERIARFLTTTLSDPAVTRELIGLVQRSLDVKGVNQALLSWMRRMSGDAGLRHQGTALMLLLISEGPEPATVTSLVDGMFSARSLVEGATEVARVVLTDPDVIRNLDESLTRLGKLPVLLQATDELLDGW